MRVNEIALSWLWFRRGMRRELGLPLLTLALAAAVAGGIALFSAQLERSVVRAANGALGADLVVRAHDPLPASVARLAGRLGLVTTTETSFPTVAVAGKRMKLASVRAVAAPYPLRGELVLRSDGAAHAADGIPPPGTVWIGPGLAAALARSIGEQLQLGSRTFRIGALVARAPDTELDFANIAPVLVMNAADLSATGLAGHQSRIRYQLLLAGKPGELERFRAQVKPTLPVGAEFRDASDVTPGLRSPLDGTRRFLRLAALATLLIAAAALIQSARHYLERQHKEAAILKTLGASRTRVRSLYALELLWLTLGASVIGIVFAWGIARGLGALAAAWFHLMLVPAPWSALAVAPATAALLAAGLWLAPILTLPNARPAAVLRGATGGKRSMGLSILAAAVAILALVLWRGAGEPALGLWTFAAAVALAGLLAGIGYSLLKLLGVPSASIRPAWRYGLAGLARRPARSLAELIAFGLALTVILVLTGVRHDLIASWRATLPADAPDHFIINIQTAQREGVEKFFATHGIRGATLYPMVRARLTAIDATPVAEWKLPPGSARGRELIRREQTLSMRAELGASTRLTAGRWWHKSDAGKPLVSADSDWARRLGVGLGDTLTFSVAGRHLVLTIASLRDVHWRSMQPNFFLVVPPGSLDDLPATWITAVRFGDNAQSALALVHRFPNLTVINVGTIIAAVKNLLRHAALALAAVFAFAFLAAVLVFLAALAASRAERARELALMRVLGARRRLLGIALAAEFAGLGALAGISAGLVAAGAGYALARWVFEIPAYFDGWLVLAGALAGVFAIGGIGFAATFGLTRAPPFAALRRSL